MANIRRLRRAQTVSPFGVGAIIDIVGESFVAEDISRWALNGTVPLKAPRLASALNVDRIRSAPQAPDGLRIDGPGIPVYRFPTWLFCGNCRSMSRWSITEEKQGEPPRCDNCKKQLVPMRFIMICSNGHMDDVDWRRWAHSRTKDPAQRDCRIQNRLEFRVRRGAGSGLESLEIVCRGCQARRDLKGIASPGSAKSASMLCRGRQPWVWTDAVESRCAETPAIVQRGASNVYFPVVESALDIPPDSSWDFGSEENLRVTNDLMFQLLLTAPEGPMANQLVATLATNAKVDEQLVRRLLSEHLAETPNGTIAVQTTLEGIKWEEWSAFGNPSESHHPKDNFVTTRADLSATLLNGGDADAIRTLLMAFSDLILAHRLHEVRALKGFYRLEQNELVAPDLGKGANWLPGIEIFGEGIFFSLDEERVAEWENRKVVRDRISTLIPRFDSSHYGNWLDSPTPRLVLIHTLAHLLIRQLTFDTGYSSSSLRERIYADDGPDRMAGALIYTAAGDSEGTLGGLVRQGAPELFGPTVATALQQAMWCSLDPICAESGGQGSDALNLAACHGCALVAETSCVSSNLFLDRELLVNPNYGFFANELDRLATARVSAVN